MKRIFVCAFCVLTGALIVAAQLPTATILGTVKDSSGASIAGATLTARDIDTNQTRTTVTAADGSYRFAALTVGNYEVRAEQTGFKVEIHTGITLVVAQQAVIDFSLQLGTVAQQVEVTAGAPIVDTTSSALSQTVTPQQMTDLPLNGRNYVQLALLQTGAVEFKQHPSSGSGANLGTTGTYFSVNGAPARANAYLLDGTSLTVYGGATGASISGSTLGLDGIKEFSIVTDTYSAQYGMVMGSQMLMVSKGGTNSFHGDGFEYLRNSALDARNYFDTAASSGTSASGQPRRLPPYRRNNFGGAIGGPIQKDKTFFYGTYEGLREALGSTHTSFTIPSSCEGPAGATITSTVCPELGTTPSVVISPQIQPWLALFPAPNLGANELSWAFTQPTQEDYGQMRIDHTFSAADTLFGRYTIDNTTQLLASSFPGYPSAAVSRGQFLTVAENHIFSPTLLNTARFSYSRSNLITGIRSYVSGPGYSFIAGEPMGTVNVGGLSGLTAGGLFSGTSQGLQNVFSYSDDAFYTRGKHSLTFGGLINHYNVFAENGIYITGAMTFASLATFLPGNLSSWTAIEPPAINSKTVRYDTLGFYVQDDYHATSRLTFNLGLRYEFNTNVEGANTAAIRNIYTDVEPTLGLMMTDPSYLNFSPRIGLAWDVRGNGKTSVRAGFGEYYDIAGWVGIMHQTFREAPFENQFTVNSPASFTLPLTFPPPGALSTRSASPYTYNMKQSKMLQYNLTLQEKLPFQMALTLGYVGSRGLDLMSFIEGNPVIPQGVPGFTSGGLETCLPRPAGYTPLNIAQQNYVDGTANTCFLGTESRRNPNWGTFDSLIGAFGDSWYNGLEIGLEKRLTRGLQFQTNFTWSKLLDTDQGQSQSDVTGAGQYQVQDPLHPYLDRGPATFNLPFASRTNLLYNFPQIRSNSFAEKLLNGWWMSTILSFQSGYPFSLSYSSSRSRSFNGGNVGGLDRPDVVAGRNNGNITHGTTAGCLGVPAGEQLGTPQLYYDPCAFTIQPSGFLGNEGRDSLIGPDFQDVDLSLVKDTKVGFLGESGSLEFRAEVFNLLNRVNFYNPSLSIFAGTGPATGDVEPPLSTAGKITEAFPSRQIQLALKVIF